MEMTSLVELFGFSLCFLRAWVCVFSLIPGKRRLKCSKTLQKPNQHPENLQLTGRLCFWFHMILISDGCDLNEYNCLKISAS